MQSVALIYQNSPVALKTLLLFAPFATIIVCFWLVRAFPRHKTLSEHDIRNIIQAEFCREAALQAKQAQMERQNMLDHNVIEWLGER